MSKARSTPTVTCPSCGAENLISTAFCKECSGRIYKDGFASTSQTKTKRRTIRSFFNALIFLALAAGIGLALWSHPASDIPDAFGSGQGVERILEAVKSNLDGAQALPEITFSQQNLNAFLGQNANSGERKVLGAQLVDNRILVMANEPLGPLNLSSRLELLPQGGSGSPLRPTKLYIGRLPLPLVLVPFWSERVSAVFGLPWDQELYDTLEIKRAYFGGMVIGLRSEQ